MLKLFPVMKLCRCFMLKKFQVNSFYQSEVTKLIVKVGKLDVGRPLSQIQSHTGKISAKSWDIQGSKLVARIIIQYHGVAQPHAVILCLTRAPSSPQTTCTDLAFRKLASNIDNLHFTYYTCPTCRQN